MNNFPTKSDIDDVEAEMLQVAAELRRLTSLRKSMLIAQWDITAGDIVREKAKRGITQREGRIGRVAQIDTPYNLGHKPKVEVRLAKKDGSFGQNIAHFWDWEKV